MYQAEDIGGLFTDPWQFPQGRATWPDVQSPEHGYMKLAGRKRILRIRQTIYEDPGNPFADEIDWEGLSPGSIAPAYKPLPPPHPILSHHAGPSVIRTHRRSKSVAVPLTGPSVGMHEYIAPRTLWRKASVPTTQLPQQLESVRENERDTKFYGFYDDILQDYRR